MLTDQKIKALKPKSKQYKVTDSAGMFLLVKSNGGKYWRMKYRFNGKEKTLAIGVYPTVSLKDARFARDEAKKLIHLGLDPVQDKQEQKLKRLELSKNSFEIVAREWIDKKSSQWTQKHAKKVLRSLELDIFPSLGRKSINDITPPILLLTIRKIESRDVLETTSRLLQRCGAVFSYGIATGVCERNPANDLKGAIASPKATNYKSLSKKELPAFLSALSKYDGNITIKLGLQLLIHTFVRTGELRQAKWSEFDLVPAERMKMGAELIVPLSAQVIDILGC